MASEKKPPIGVKPKWLVDENRAEELISALEAYAASPHHGAEHALEWGKELREVIERMIARDTP